MEIIQDQSCNSGTKLLEIQAQNWAWFFRISEMPKDENQEIKIKQEWQYIDLLTLDT